MDFKRIGDYFVKDEVARNKIVEETEARKTAISQIFDSINTAVTNRLNEFGNSVTTTIGNLTNYVNENVGNLISSFDTKVDKEKFYVISGEYHKTTPEVEEYVEIDYPEGFTCDNSTIISASQRKGDDSGWMGQDKNDKNDDKLDGHWYMGANKIRFYTTGHVVTLDLNIEYQIVLMKLD